MFFSKRAFNILRSSSLCFFERVELGIVCLTYRCESRASLEGQPKAAVPTSIQDSFADLGGQLGALTPNCRAYSAFSRCQPANFMASAPAMRPMGVPLSR